MRSGELGAVAPYSGPEPGESTREATQRRHLNAKRRDAWRWLWDDRCACGQVRFHVTHEQDPENSPEGMDYFADMLDALHPFNPVHPDEAAHHESLCRELLAGAQ